MIKPYLQIARFDHWGKNVFMLLGFVLAWFLEPVSLSGPLFAKLAFGFVAGVFIVRYHLTLVLFLPFASAFIAHYLKIGLKENSPVQNPEKLFKERGFVAMALFCGVVFLLLMHTEIHQLYEWFNVEPSDLSPLWEIGP